MIEGEECRDSQIIMERTERRLRREKEVERVNCPGGPLTKPLTVESGQAQMSFQPNLELKDDPQLSG